MKHPVLLLPLVLAAVTAARAASALVPPSPDFSAYAKKSPWTLDESFLAEAAAKRPNSNFYESKVAHYLLPDLFTFAAAGGGKATDPATWETRRAELLELFRGEVYGFAPPRPDTLAFRVIRSDPRAMEGRATLKQVAISLQLGGETFAFNLTLFVPNRRPGPAPVFLLLNHRGPDNTDPTRENRSEFWPAEYAIDRGYAMAAVNVSAEVEPDRRDATTGVRAFYKKHAALAGGDFTWGALAAWAWAGSRAVDYFITDSDLDSAQIAVIGHSRSGKTSLWAAAQDPRFALAAVNCSGEGGASLSRHNIGETLRQITSNFPHWFVPGYARYADDPARLPVDQHQLIALVAPRGCHGGDGTLDLHADPRGAWLALVAASPAWALHGRATALPDAMPLVNDLLLHGPLAYHLREGGHALTTFDWKLYLDHADALFGRPRR